MNKLVFELWRDDSGFDLPEYAIAAVVLTAILVEMKSLDIHGSDLLANMGIKLHGMPR